MQFTKNSPILGSSNITDAQLAAAFEPMTPPSQIANMRKACKVIVADAKATGVHPLALASIGWIETGAPGTGLPFRSEWWVNGFNFGNLGITGDDGQNAAAQTWSTPGDGVHATTAHLVAYAYGKNWRSAWDVDELGDPTVIDKRFQKAIDNTPSKAGVKTLADLNRRWAIDADDDYGGKLAERANKIVAAIVDQSPPVETPSTPPEPVRGEGDQPVTAQYLDYSSLSFPVEVRFIPASHTHQRTGIPMTPAYTTWHDTGNPNPRTNAESHADWMLDGCRNDKGEVTDTSWHFTVDDGKAIQHIPLNEVAWHAGDGYNGPGNRTSIAIEECINSDRDAEKTRSNAAELHALLITELKLQDGTINALVQHNRWSGKDCPEIIRGLGLWPTVINKVSGFIAKLGGGKPSYAQAHPIAKGSQIINDHQFLAPGGKTFQRDTIPAEWGDGKDNPTGPTIKKGTKITDDQISHYVVGTDGVGTEANIWVVLTGVAGVADGSRVPASALIAA